MDKMLGNQYFMAGKFKDAIPHFETRLEKEPDDWRTTKNLVVCYLAEEALDEALTLLKTLLQQAPAYEMVWKRQDTCPCRDVMADWMKNPHTRMGRLGYLLSMGILSLFCEPELAEIYFKQAEDIAPDMELLRRIRTATSHNQDNINKEF